MANLEHVNTSDAAHEMVPSTQRMLSRPQLKLEEKMFGVILNAYLFGKKVVGSARNVV